MESEREDSRLRVQNVAERLLEMIELAVQDAQTRMHQRLEKREKEGEKGAEKGKPEALLDMGELKQFTAVLKEIVALQMSEYEEEASVTVVLEGEVEQYAN